MKALERAKAEATLSWYYQQVITPAFRSTFGHQLEKQQALYFDSDNKAIGKADRKSWVYIHLNPTQQSSEPSYTFQPSTGSLREASISRRLRRLTPRQQTVLEARYSDDGETWERMFGPKEDGSSYVLTSLYRLFPLGVRILNRHRTWLADGPYRMTRWDATPIEVFADYLKSEALSKSEQRKAELRVLERTAQVELADALKAFMATEVKPCLE